MPIPRPALSVVTLLISLIAAGCGDDGGKNLPERQAPAQPEAETQTPSYTVIAVAGTGGTISPTTAVVTEGAAAVLTITPDTGFHVAAVTPTGCTGTLTGTTYTTGPVTADCAVVASFAANTYTVSATAGAGGTIAPGSVSVTHGERTVLAVTPDAGFIVAEVSASGCTGMLEGASFTTSAITADCAVVASFAALPVASSYTVSAGAGTGGSITPASVVVAEGAGAVLTVTPNTGFNIAGVSASGCSGTLAGTTFITGPVTADCTVTATFAAIFHTVTANAGTGGSISPTSASIAHGTGATLTVIPAAGFAIASVNASGCTGTLTGTTYTTGPITADCTVTASFSANVFTVTTSAGTGGSIAPASVSVAQGGSAVLTVTPDAGYTIASVVASGCGGILSGTTYTAGPVNADCSVAASFAAITSTYTVTASAGTGGSITPATLGVAQGETAVLTVTANPGYSIASVTPTGCTGTLAGTAFTTGPITANCSVVASFSANAWTVTASAGTGGSITPARISVAHGATTALTLTPDTGFAIAGIAATGCSGTLAETTYTTGAITANCTIIASFAVVTPPALASGIATGGSHSCALTSTGAVQCWGDNFFGELGNGTTTNSLVPVAATGLSGAATALVAGVQHSCALISGGGVQCWGYNAYGQLGNDSTRSSSAPVAVTGLSGPVTALAAGSYHTCALTEAGTVQCWGYNANGQLGRGNLTNSVVPATVTALAGTATALVAGAQHTCALISGGAMQCWGNNANGQLGDGSTTRATEPVTVKNLSGAAMAMAAGSNHSCALTSTGVVQCWGYNATGQLGNDTTTHSAVPVTVSGVNGTVSMLAAGNAHTCALGSSGAVQCWGGNNYGQLGNGGTTNSSVAVAVTGLGGAASVLKAGYGHNCIVTTSGAAQCWGYNLYGQLGNGSTANATAPVDVTGLGATP
jgi:alpha-tubulin suppressor-like RCC1 family protein